MKKINIAASLFIAGMLLATFGLLTRDSGTETVASADAVVSLASLEPFTGLKPIGEVVALFEQRSAGSELDYINRTHLGNALNSQARENADLAGYEAAEVVLRQALKINPIYKPAKLALASSVHSQHRFAEARDLATEVWEQDSSALSAFALLGDASYELGDYDRAATVYEDLAILERSAPVVSRLAQISAAQGNNEGALTLAIEARDLAQGYPLRPAGQAFYWFQVAHFEFTLGDVDSAVASLDRALVIDPGNPGSSEMLAGISAATGDLDRAASLYEQLLESGPAADLHGSYAKVLRALDRKDEAAEQDALGRTLADETRDRFPAERRHLVGFYLTQDPAIALELAELDLADRQDYGAYETLAWAQYHNRMYAKAAINIEAALATGATNASLLYRAGAIAAANGDLERARAYVADALELNPYFDATEAADAAKLLAEL